MLESESNTSQNNEPISRKIWLQGLGIYIPLTVAMYALEYFKVSSSLSHERGVFFSVAFFYILSKAGKQRINLNFNRYLMIMLLIVLSISFTVIINTFFPCSLAPCK